MSLLDGLISYWPFDEGSGTTAEDVHGTNEGALLSGTGVWAAGILGSSFDFNQSTRMGVGTSDELNLLTAGSISAWIHPDDLGDASLGRIFDRYLSGDGYVFFVADSTGNKIAFLGNASTVFSTGDITLNAWNHVVVTWDSGTATMYIGGSASGSGSYTGIDTLVGGTAVIGSNLGGNRDFDGEIDEVGIWDRALTSGEVSELWNGGAGLAYADFEEESEVIETYDDPLGNPYTFQVPEGVTEVKLEFWGGGGDSQIGVLNCAGGGGGGYARIDAFAVDDTSGEFFINVPENGLNNGSVDYNEDGFMSPEQVFGLGNGADGAAGVGGVGGEVFEGTYPFDASFTGGAGEDGDIIGTSGGGGGSSAGTAANGDDAVGVNGGTAPVGGGDGGNGGAIAENGTNGFAPGGGAGAPGDGGVEAVGANGKVVITYTTGASGSGGSRSYAWLPFGISLGL